MTQLVLAIRSRPLPLHNSSPPSLAETGAIAVQSGQGQVAAQTKVKKKRKKKAKNRFTNAYGSNFHGPEPWIRLCRDLGVVGILNSKNQCKKASPRP